MDIDCNMFMIIMRNSTQSIRGPIAETEYGTTVVVLPVLGLPHPVAPALTVAGRSPTHHQSTLPQCHLQPTGVTEKIVPLDGPD